MALHGSRHRHDDAEPGAGHAEPGGPEDLGSASSVVTFFRSLGGAVGVSALGAVLANRVTALRQGRPGRPRPQGRRAGATGGTAAAASPTWTSCPRRCARSWRAPTGTASATSSLRRARARCSPSCSPCSSRRSRCRRKADWRRAAEAPSRGRPAGGRRGRRPPAGRGAGARPGGRRRCRRRPTSHARRRAAAAAVAPRPGGVRLGRRRGRHHPGTVACTASCATRRAAPVPRAAVTLISLGGRQLGRSVAQADGSYALDAPGAGSYVLIAAADGHQPQASTVVVGDEPLALRHPAQRHQRARAASVRGAADGAAGRRARWSSSPTSAARCWPPERTGEQGDFAFDELVPGTFTVAVNAAGLPAGRAAGRGRRPGRHPDRGRPAGRRAGAGHRAGRCRTAGPLPDARVTLVDAAGNVVATATTGEDGAYAFTDLDAGDYTVIASGYPPVATGPDGRPAAGSTATTSSSPTPASETPGPGDRPERYADRGARRAETRPGPDPGLRRRRCAQAGDGLHAAVRSPTLTAARSRRRPGTNERGNDSTGAGAGTAGPGPHPGRLGGPARRADRHRHDGRAGAARGGGRRRAPSAATEPLPAGAVHGHRHGRRLRAGRLHRDRHGERPGRRRHASCWPGRAGPSCRRPAPGPSTRRTRRWARSPSTWGSPACTAGSPSSAAGSRSPRTSTEVAGRGGHQGRVASTPATGCATGTCGPPDFLNVEQYPEITYRSSGLAPAGPDRWTVHGELSHARCRTRRWTWT